MSIHLSLQNDLTRIILLSRFSNKRKIVYCCKFYNNEYS